ncbi:Structure-specific endonuclease subunit slx1 [Quillaja saponaria]|uniref:Structure-specific endonuclease subunit slx1 n=1 Tax=Quillaja saponaria TaxID=32244 RepID=A0AAD7L112_QUISA|nr:Structure-specific endonuclease subunit slx1 [Quillaja saponaria]
MMRVLSKTFRSIKASIPNPNLSKTSSPSPSIVQKSEAKSSLRLKSGSWCVYLILSTNAPIKTYVGVTTNFSRRLKQHNGELKGGAKASRAGRPWICACIVCGFTDRSEACEFESKWKYVSRKSPREKENDDSSKKMDDASLPLLRHRQAALNKVRGSLDSSHLEIIWDLNSL